MCNPPFLLSNKLFYSPGGLQAVKSGSFGYTVYSNVQEPVQKSHLKLNFNHIFPTTYISSLPEAVLSIPGLFGSLKGQSQIG